MPSQRKAKNEEAVSKGQLLFFENLLKRKEDSSSFLPMQDIILALCK
jgi:hypothetical protein